VIFTCSKERTLITYSDLTDSVLISLSVCIFFLTISHTSLILLIVKLQVYISIPLRVWLAIKEVRYHCADYKYTF